MSNASRNGQFPGLYRGTVTLNTDPEFRGRLLLMIPDVTTFVPSTWAEPCTPLAGPTGPGMGVYMVPTVGAAVWVMFEHGDVNKPVWMGCRFDTQADAPSMSKLSNPLDPSIIISTVLQNQLIISDLPPTPLTGGIVLQTTTGAMLVVNDSGIYIDNGKGASIWLVGPTITFNKTAMAIT
ncbi:phage baseplate assembly protein V [Lysobacter enzymogenes]|uniref:phage baseplate assembly protein V n=1 Tax=Lysobacter enzymogenes TaxID=69 RepID=UPI001A972488|nr:phage baseplate assembly protein V [Lysobacter enzymogenes]QQP98140.1 baseplate assembly protein [Lysobacter enzymogenes]